MANIIGKVKELSECVHPKVIQWRRHIHMYPELSGREFGTSEFVADTLREMGIHDVWENFAQSTAVVCNIKGKSDSYVALRADMDALPINEKTQAPYSSKINGVMHACGHDAHTAILLGVAYVLHNMKEHLYDSVRLIFQPCEERYDCKGAKHLVENGVLENVSSIYALHVFPDLPSGKIGVKPGVFLASSDEFSIVIKGKGTHASKPHEGVDPILISAQVINSLHHIVSRKIDPLNPAVVTVGKIKGGFAANVIPDEVKIEGTIRTLNFKEREKFPELIENIVKHVSKAYGGDYSFSLKQGNPPLINDKTTTEFVINILNEAIGENNVVILERPTMGGEDFSFYLQKVPGTFLRLGTRSQNRKTHHPLHSPMFDIDENALIVGVIALSCIALKTTNKEL